MLDIALRPITARISVDTGYISHLRSFSYEPGGSFAWYHGVTPDKSVIESLQDGVRDLVGAIHDRHMAATRTESSSALEFLCIYDRFVGTDRMGWYEERVKKVKVVRDLEWGWAWDYVVE